ncbi:phasin [Oricola cellulosilytica]|uniref:Phasin n=1 Tax=Oricola cellulosilytica TaxID=1429082 RepID=A0A4R0PJR8_9HYPH|nr:phasin [Oricola cellulosilytica]TCD16600.1 phasin [Oricola cellulosilytica]
MAKTTTKTNTADVFAFPAMDTAPFADQFRTFAEQGMTKSKEAYDQMKASIEDAQKTVETTVESAQDHSRKLSLTAINIMRANAEAGFSHLEKLLGVKSVSEAFEVQGAFVRKQAEQAVDQAKELQNVSKDAFEAVSAPAKAATEKAVANVKAA